MIRMILVLLVLGAAVSCAQDSQKIKADKSVEKSTFVLTSNAFEEGAMIPKLYTCDSTNVSPELKWTGAPEGTKSFALIADDPDAPQQTWVHWVAYNIDPNMDLLKSNIQRQEIPDSTMRQGLSDFGRFGYGGPCPPSGVHRYYFKLYALDEMLPLQGRVNMAGLEAAMKGHILAETQLMGRYTREK